MQTLFPELDLRIDDQKRYCSDLSHAMWKGWLLHDLAMSSPDRYFKSNPGGEPK